MLENEIINRPQGRITNVFLFHVEKVIFFSYSFLCSSFSYFSKYV